jgi:hypothetical protein
MRKITATLLTAAVLALPLAHAASATYGGAPLQAGDPMLRSVIKLEVRHGDWRSFCTGVIVSPKVIATAAHCLFRDDNAAEPVPAQSVSVSYYHDKALGRVSSMRYDKINDLALLTTVQAHPKGFLVPEQDLRPIEEIVQNSKAANFIHFGHGPMSDKAPAMLTKLDDKPLTLQAPDGVRLRMLHPNFPEPRGTCGGDSGGPVMIQDANGPLKLIGIHQAGQRDNINYAITDSAGNCSRVSYFSPMSRLKTWERDVAQAERAGPRRLRTPSPEIIRMGKGTKPASSPTIAPEATPPAGPAS